MSLKWSITDPAKGARTIEEITEKAKLGKTSKNRFNCSHAPMFPFIPIQHVVIDSLHLFLRIADVLINLLIRDLIVDGIDKATGADLDKTNATNVKAYAQFLNGPCKIRFHWYVDKDTKKLKWRDLTGPEKNRLFKNMDVPVMFPALQHKQQIQQLWSEFFTLINLLGNTVCDAVESERRVKAWVQLFTSKMSHRTYIHLPCTFQNFCICMEM